ncbi:MAG: quinone oxidoreductase family protein [Minwuia sp.]|uniref:quinone oxidoreductase family protein n=1 Tax=Minwuia sp. TaxID=2493630 RepID=UPI003A842CCB
MVKAIRVHKPGGPEAMVLEDVEVGEPGPGEARIRHTAIGLNYIDVYHRSGLYPVEPPYGVGMEGAAVVEAIGDGVTNIAVGDRVAYADPPPGSYCEARLFRAERLVKVPDNVADETAAAMMLKGMTVEYLVHRTYAVSAGETVLFHAAAGGVGLIAGQWLKALGVRAIGTAGGPEKVALAKAHGYAEVIDYDSEDFQARLMELTDGKGVPVVYDSVGKATFEKSLDCLQPRGLYVNFGNASGPVDAFNAGMLAAKGSLYMTRPTLMTYNAKPDDLATSAGRLMEMVGSGKVKIEINQRYALADAVQAHKDLEARKTTGSTVILP